MKKYHLLILSIVILLLVSCQKPVSPPVEPPAPTNEKKLIVHYKRFDSSYLNWNLWLWEESPIEKDGKQYNFTKSDDFGKVAEIPLTTKELLGSTKVGFIVRKGNWLDKDINEDRFIDVTKVNEQKEVHVWLVQGDSTIYTNPSDMSKVAKIYFAEFTKSNEITFYTNQKLSIDDVLLYQNDELLNVDSIELYESTEGGVIKLSNINLSYPYKLKIGDLSINVGISKLFNTDQFETDFYYNGDDLGVTYTKDQSIFKVWAPTAKEMKLNIYTSGDYRNNDLEESIDMTRYDKGIWSVTVSKDLNGKYYTYTVTDSNDPTSYNVIDPYAKSAGLNGRRGMIFDLSSTNPDGWEDVERPELLNIEDSIIYEAHIRDLSIHSSSGIVNKGKFLGLTESNTKYEGVTTGLDHLKELGITHLHILPSFDYRSVDELSSNQFNWGYDPQNYNVPEGSYATNPFDGTVRVKEFKEMVQTLHENDIRVVMDVVYNHTSQGFDSNFNRLVPNYYYRMVNGAFSNGSGCGNEIASERIMTRKFIVDSVIYWAKEYKVDGFRFDLMGLHDIETMNTIRTELNKIDPSIIVYGEGWTAGDSPLLNKALRDNVKQMEGIAVFNDISRDGIKGSTFNASEGGFVQGANRVSDVKLGILGATSSFAGDPVQTVNYVSAHDNLTLWDKITRSSGNVNLETQILMAKQANAIVLTSQGIPFIHAGADFLRTKNGNDNSYNASDSINSINYSRKAEYIEVFNYYKGLIELRKAHPAFRMSTKSEIDTHLKFMVMPDQTRMIGYTISGNANGDTWKTIAVMFNASKEIKEVTLPESGTWTIVVDKNQAGVEAIRQVTGNKVLIEANESLVLYLQ